MAYKTCEQQASEHIAFLRECGLEVNSLQINSSHFISCREIGGTSLDKNLAYKTFVNPMAAGRCGLVTIARLKDRSQRKYRTYGEALGPLQSYSLVKSAADVQKELVVQHKEAARKAKYFWDYSSEVGHSDYLKRKRVGSHGIRFRSNEYGNVAVVPLRDIHGTLWSYQLLNPRVGDRQKLFAKDARFMGLFHVLTDIVDGKPVGIAESYVTAATCYELSGVSCVSAFSCENLQGVVSALRERYPSSPIIIFADNDRCSNGNPGISKANAVAKAIANVYVMGPDFGDIPASKSSSDWNDLMMLMGVDAARRQLVEKIEHALNCRIESLKLFTP